MAASELPVAAKGGSLWDAVTLSPCAADAGCPAISPSSPPPSVLLLLVVLPVFLLSFRLLPNADDRLAVPGAATSATQRAKDRSHRRQ